MTKKDVKKSKEAETFLDGFRQYKNESDGKVIENIISAGKKSKSNPNLNQRTVKEVMEARERIRKGEYNNEEEARKIFGL